MFDDLLSINFMLVVLLFAAVTVLGMNIIMAVASFILSLIIKGKKL